MASNEIGTSGARVAAPLTLTGVTYRVTLTEPLPLGDHNSYIQCVEIIVDGTGRVDRFDYFDRDGSAAVIFAPDYALADALMLDMLADIPLYRPESY